MNKARHLELSVKFIIDLRNSKGYSLKVYLKDFIYISQSSSAVARKTAAARVTKDYFLCTRVLKKKMTDSWKITLEESSLETEVGCFASLPGQDKWFSQAVWSDYLKRYIKVSQGFK